MRGARDNRMSKTLANDDDLKGFLAGREDELSDDSNEDMFAGKLPLAGEE